VVQRQSQCSIETNQQHKVSRYVINF